MAAGTALSLGALMSLWRGVRGLPHTEGWGKLSSQTPKQREEAQQGQR